MSGKKPVDVSMERQRLEKARTKSNKAHRALRTEVQRASQKAERALNDFLKQVILVEGEIPLPGELAAFLAECWAISEYRNPPVGHMPFVSYVYDMLDHSEWTVSPEKTSDMKPHDAPFDKGEVTVVLKRIS